MAKYQVTYGCGHSSEVQLQGSYADRERRMAQMADGLCPACYQAQQAAQRAEQNTKAAAANQTAGLPQLAGSDKQVAWAETIRAEKLAQLDDMLITSRKSMEQQGVAPTTIEQRLASIAPYAERIRNTTAASWWIDHRSEAVTQMIQAMYQADHK